MCACRYFDTGNNLVPYIELCYRIEHIHLISRGFRNAKRKAGNEISYEFELIVGGKIGLSHKSQHVKWSSISWILEEFETKQQKKVWCICECYVTASTYTLTMCQTSQRCIGRQKAGQEEAGWIQVNEILVLWHTVSCWVMKSPSWWSEQSQQKVQWDSIIRVLKQLYET
jgi:hypothetical protein